MHKESKLQGKRYNYETLHLDLHLHLFSEACLLKMTAFQFDEMIVHT